MNPSLLVVGADGQIGGALLAALGPRAAGTTRRDTPGRIPFDLAADPSRWALPFPVSQVFLCAAVTSLAACEADPAGTARLNVDHTLALARRLADAGAFPVFLSTNLVFDGSVPRRPAMDRPCPATAYGRQKAAGEAGILALGGAVVRLTKVVTPAMPLFQAWRRDLEAGTPIHPFTDLRMAPLPLAHVVRALALVGAARQEGIHQVSGARDLTYAEVAAHLAARLGAAPGLVQPVASTLDPTLRPAHTTLDDARVRTEFGLTPPEPFEALDLALDLP